MAEKEIDYAFFCCDGVFNMGLEETAQCAELMNAKHNIPYHMTTDQENRIILVPEVLTWEEASALLRVCTNSKHRALLLFAYSFGLRCDEIEKLRVKDIDSKEMRIFVKGGEIQKVEKRACIFHSGSV